MCVREEGVESYFRCVLALACPACLAVCLSALCWLRLESCEGPRPTSTHPSNHVLGHQTPLHKSSRDESGGGGGSGYKFTLVVLQLEGGVGWCRWVKEEQMKDGTSNKPR